jgi:hypothetical protein
MISTHLKTLFIFLLIYCISACDSADEQKKSNTEIADTKSASDFNSFLFLTEWFDKVGVYKYEIEKKKYSPVWWHPRENVVLLVYKPGNFPAYFFTAQRMGERANFPLFSRLKLFIISPDLSETKQIDKLGNGLQFTARWNSDNNLEVIYTSVDKTIASYINQYTKVYDHYGKLIDSDLKTFDMEKSGFPELLPPRNKTLSPSGNFGVSFREDSVFLKTAGSDSIRFIVVMEHNLNKISWSDDEKFLLISTLNLENETTKTKKPETSELFIYSLSADTLVDVFGGSGLKNFFSTNDLLIFDNGFGNNSVINIYNFNKQAVVDSIRTKEGCGLVAMPQL